MNKLPPKAARLLDEARRSHRAPPADLERTLKRLHATLPFADAGGALAEGASRSDAATSPTPTLGVRGSALFTGHGVKWLIATVAIGGAVGGAVLTRTSVTKTAQRTPPVAQVRSASEAQQSRQSDRLHASGAAGYESARTAADRASSASTVSGAKRGVARALRADEARSAKGGASASPSQADVAQAEVASGSEGRGTSLLGGRERLRGVKTERKERETARAETAQSATIEAPGAPVPAGESDARAASAAAQPVAVAPGELDLIDGALARLRDQNGAAALALLAQHDQLYPRGKFATERKGLRVVALCAVGRVREGREAQAAFLEHARGAPIAARVRRACEPEKP